MRKAKWIFFGYLALVALVIGGLAVSFSATPPRDPGTLYSTYSDSVKTLDAPEINDTLGNGIGGNISECLYNYKYGVKPYELFPQLAAEMPQRSEDGTTITVKIRKGIRFYDPDKIVWGDGVGPEVKAQDFVYSWKRLANFHLASTLYSQLFEGRIVGLDDWFGYTKTCAKNKDDPAVDEAGKPKPQIDWDRPIEGLQAPDDRTLRIKLVEPYPQLIYNLAYLPTAVVCREVVEHYGDDVRWHPVGTGPYCLRYADHLHEQRIVMYANPTYRGRPDIDGNPAGGSTLPDADRLPHVKRLQYEYFQEPVPIWLLFQQGLFDYAGVPKDTFSQAIRIESGTLTPEMEKKGIKLETDPEPAVYYLGLNMQDPVLGKNKPLRQAISMALDREKFIRIFRNGRGKQPIGPIPPGFPTYDDSRTNPYARYDLPAARAKLEEAKKIQGGPIPAMRLLMGGTSTEDRQYAEFFVSQFRALGIEMEVDYRTWARMQDMIDNRQAQVFMFGWNADYPDEQDFFQLFYGKNAGPGGSNSTAYVNPRFDEIYEKASHMEPSPGRDKLYRQMEEITMEDCPWALLYYPLTYTLYYDWLGHFQVPDYGNGFRQFWTLDSQERQDRQQSRKQAREATRYGRYGGRG